MASASYIVYRVVRIKGKSESARIWRTVNMTYIFCVVTTPRQISSRRVGSSWHRDVLISASEIMERNLSAGGGRESERESKRGRTV